jgi:hypothetical protein
MQCIKTKKPYTLTGFEPGIFWSGGGRGDHYATPLGQVYILRKRAGLDRALQVQEQSFCLKS